MSGFCDIFGSYAGVCRSLFYSGKSQGTSGCGVNPQGGPGIIQKSESDGEINIPPTQVGDARVGGESGITINDAGVAIIPAPYLVNIARDRAQGTDIKIAPIKLTMPNVGNKTIKIIVETVPETLDPSLAGQSLDGLINVNHVAQSSKAYPIKDSSGKILYYIVDPTKPQNRAPVYMGAYTLQDNLNSNNNINQTTCSAGAVLGQASDAGVVQNCESYRIQAKGSQNSYEFVVPKATYNNGKNSLSIDFGFTLRVNTSNMIPGHKYMLYLKVKLVVGESGVTADSGTTTADTGTTVTPDAGVPVPDTLTPDAGMTDK